ncbi:arginine deiminase family protein [Methanolobus sp. ZRKC3]|uniref:dimethylarginine dimethylaminohydrolase family protein n=1 Tax=Methanolobus sp. ZRKC3 TaxID=3125786 RepID=UPI003246FE55
MTEKESGIPDISYGCDELGRLKRVLLHTPGEDELSIIKESNMDYWLFDSIPDIESFVQEHQSYHALLEDHGVKVHQLREHVEEHQERIKEMPNLTYLHDVAVISKKGAMLSRMRPPGRTDEEVVVKEALNNLDIPILTEFNDGGHIFEGCLLLSPETILVANTERHNKAAIEKFTENALKEFEEVIITDIPKARRFMHPDTIFNRIRPDLALVYLPAFLQTHVHREDGVEEVDFQNYMKEKEMDLIPVSDSEQQRLACSFVPLESGTIFHYDDALDASTEQTLAKEGVEIIHFHADALHAGGGSLRCHTMRLHRKL